MCIEDRFISEEFLLNKIGGELKNILITGKAGTGKSYLADRFADKYGSQVTNYDGGELKEIILEHELSVIREEIMRRRKSERPALNAKRFLIIDNLDYGVRDNSITTLANNSDFAWILNNSESVRLYVILVIQDKQSLLEIAGGTLDSLIHVDLDN